MFKFLEVVLFLVASAILGLMFWSALFNISFFELIGGIKW
jgi:hypothetical protein